MSSRAVGTVLGLASALVALFSMACGVGYYHRNDAYFGTGSGIASGKLSTGGFVAGGGTITSSTTIGGYPVSGVSVGPSGTTIYGGAPYGAYGGGYGSPRGPGYGGPGYGGGAYGYDAYGNPYGYVPYGYGTYSSCTGAVACGSSTSVTVERSGASISVP